LIGARPLGSNIMVQTRWIVLKLPVDFRDHPILITRSVSPVYERSELHFEKL